MGDKKNLALLEVAICHCSNLTLFQHSAVLLPSTASQKKSNHTPKEQNPSRDPSPRTRPSASEESTPK